MPDPQRTNRIGPRHGRISGRRSAAANQLIEVLHPELRRLAAAKDEGRAELGGWRIESDEEGKAAFLQLAGHIKKHLLIDHARPLYRRVLKGEVLASEYAPDLRWGQRKCVLQGQERSEPSGKVFMSRDCSGTYKHSRPLFL